MTDAETLLDLAKLERRIEYLEDNVTDLRMRMILLSEQMDRMQKWADRTEGWAKRIDEWALLVDEWVEGTATGTQKPRQ